MMSVIPKAVLITVSNYLFTVHHAAQLQKCKCKGSTHLESFSMCMYEFGRSTPTKSVL